MPILPHPPPNRVIFGPPLASVQRHSDQLIEAVVFVTRRPIFALAQDAVVAVVKMEPLAVGLLQPVARAYPHAVQPRLQNQVTRRVMSVEFIPPVLALGDLQTAPRVVMIFGPPAPAVFDPRQVARRAVVIAPRAPLAVRRLHDFAQAAPLIVILNQFPGPAGQFLEDQPVLADVKAVPASGRIDNDKATVVTPSV